MITANLVFQVVRIGGFRCDKSIERELCAETEAGDETVEGGFAIDGCPRIDILEEAFPRLTRELICEKVLACYHCSSTFHIIYTR